MLEKEDKKNRKIKLKKILILIFIIFLFFGCLYYFGKMFLHFSWKHSLRYRNDVECLISRPKCFYVGISKKEFIRRMEYLEISKKEAVQKLIETKKKYEKKCAGNEAIKIPCDQNFEYFDKVFKYLDEMPD